MVVTCHHQSQLKTFQKEMKRVSIWIGMNAVGGDIIIFLNSREDYMHFCWILDISGKYSSIS